MTLTEHCSIYVSIHEDAFNHVVRHIQRQRPSMFTYATAAFEGLDVDKLTELFCCPIDVDERVIKLGEPLFTVQDPLPVFGTPYQIGLNWCLQLTEVQLDLHPNSTIDLPPQLQPFPEQGIALRLAGCFGLDCADDDFVEQQLELIEAQVVAEGDLLSKKLWSKIGPPREDRRKPPKPDDRRRKEEDRPDDDDGDDDEPETVTPPLSGKLRCVHLAVVAVLHAEWVAVADHERSYLRFKLDGLEIVDIEPTELEDTIECYLAMVLRLGVLPQLTTSMESLTFDITATMREWGARLEQAVSLHPTPSSDPVPHNPEVADDELRGFVDLTVETVEEV